MCGRKTCSAYSANVVADPAVGSCNVFIIAEPSIITTPEAGVEVRIDPK